MPVVGVRVPGMKREIDDDNDDGGNLLSSSDVSRPEAGSKTRGGKSWPVMQWPLPLASWPVSAAMASGESPCRCSTTSCGFGAASSARTDADWTAGTSVRAASRLAVRGNTVARHVRASKA